MNINETELANHLAQLLHRGVLNPASGSFMDELNAVIRFNRVDKSEEAAKVEASSLDKAIGVTFMPELIASSVEQIKKAIKESEKNIIMTTKADLDAAIAALPSQIESAVESALAPVITAIQSAAASNGVDLSAEVTSLQAIPASVSANIAAALTPTTPAPAASTGTA